jgi:hypothetical protein
MKDRQEPYSAMPGGAAEPRVVKIAADALLVVRKQHPNGMEYGGVWRPEGVTFREIAERDAKAIIEALVETGLMPPARLDA